MNYMKIIMMTILVCGDFNIDLFKSNDHMKTAEFKIV